MKEFAHRATYSYTPVASRYRNIIGQRTPTRVNCCAKLGYATRRPAPRCNLLRRLSRLPGCRTPSGLWRQQAFLLDAHWSRASSAPFSQPLHPGPVGSCSQSVVGSGNEWTCAQARPLRKLPYIQCHWINSWFKLSFNWINGTMDYPMEAKNSGWFSSLRRTRRTEGECGANVKSLEDIASSAAVDASDDAVTQVKKSWRSLFHRKTRKLSSSAQSSSSSSSCEYENVNSVRNETETETETVTAQFWTLPRKRNATGPAARLCAVASPPALPPAAAAAPVRRLRSFSSSTLVAKRSTVWYQQCSLDGGVRVANDVTFVSNYLFLLFYCLVDYIE